MSKVFGVVLAGESGPEWEMWRKPKQFLELGGKPIIIIP